MGTSDQVGSPFVAMADGALASNRQGSGSNLATLPRTPPARRTPDDPDVGFAEGSLGAFVEAPGIPRSGSSQNLYQMRKSQKNGRTFSCGRCLVISAMITGVVAVAAGLFSHLSRHG